MPAIAALRPPKAFCSSGERFSAGSLRTSSSRVVSSSRSVFTSRGGFGSSFRHLRMAASSTRVWGSVRPGRISPMLSRSKWSNCRASRWLLPAYFRSKPSSCGV